MRYAKYSMAALLVASMMFVVPQLAYSQAGTLTVRVDKGNYAAGEEIRISGTVPAVIEGVPVAIQVFNPRNTMYTIDQVTPNADGTYSTTIKVGGKLGIGGIYTVKATYSNQSVQTQFELTGEVGACVAPNCIVVTYEDNKIEVKYDFPGGSIRSIEVDPDFTSIILSISAANDSELTITLPRKLVDSLTDGCVGDDDEFIVLVDGEEETADETDTSSSDRTLVIPIPGGAEEVEIIGTCVIPEFGIIAPLVLAAAVGAIIVASRKNQILKFLPHY
jgi:predicted secreted protein with PEFG-CTERM motif